MLRAKIILRCNVRGWKLVLHWRMFHVRADPSVQLLTISFSQHVNDEEMKRCLAEIKKSLMKMNRGFSLLTDLSHLEEMDASCAPMIGEIMDLCNKRKISVAARVIPDPGKDIGFNLMSQFHYSADVQTRTFENLAEAMRMLPSQTSDDS